jgi:phage terminase large subunit-like protein
MRDTDFRLLGPATILEPPRDGTMLEPHLVENAILEMHGRNPIAVMVMDTTKAEQLAVWIESELGIPVVDRQQTNSLAALDFERFMEGLREGKLHHTGDPGLTRHALNAVAHVLPLGDTRFERPAKGQNRRDQPRRVIDALVAASMAHCTAVEELGRKETVPLVALA